MTQYVIRRILSSIPVLLGGHSLMSGGLMLLNEFAWQESEAGELL